MLSIIGLSFLLAVGLLSVALFMALRSDRLALSAVIGGALSAIARAPLTFIGLAMATTGAPAVLAAALGSQTTTPTGVAATMSLGLVATLLVFAWYQLGTLAMVAATLLAGQGPVRPRSVLARALPLVPQAMLVSLIFWIAVGIGLSLFIVPEAILACVWMLVLPVLVAERPTLFATFSRSAALTRGVRWQLFLLVIIGFVGGLVVQAMLAAVAALLGGGLVAQVGFALAVSLLSVLPPALVASAYQTIVAAREGPGAAELQQIFA